MLSLPPSVKVYLAIDPVDMRKGMDALANVEAVSRERRCIRGFLGGSVVPAVR